MKPRSRWLDSTIAASLALTVLLVAGVLWQRAPIRLAVARTTEVVAPVPPLAASIPEGFGPLWSQPDEAAAAPMVVGGTLVTASAGALTGWSALTGKQMWRFAEPAPLCAATTAWGKVYAVYREQRGCSLVVSLDGATGARPVDLHADNRSSDGDQQIRLMATTGSDGSAVQESQSLPGSWSPHLILAMGSRRLELWHEGLLRSVEYGRVAAPVEPKKQPRHGCSLRSALVGSEAFAVLQSCPRDAALRLSFVKNTSKHDTDPDETHTVVLSSLSPGDGAQLLAVRGERVALYVPATAVQGAKITVVDALGEAQASYDLNLSVTAKGSAPWRTSSRLITWWTGTGVVGLDPVGLSVLFQTPDLAGPATAMAGQLLAPTATGLAVLDPGSGAKLREIPTPQAQADPAGVRLAVCGAVVLRQQAGQVVAYGAPSHP